MRFCCLLPMILMISFTSACVGTPMNAKKPEKYETVAFRDVKGKITEIDRRKAAIQIEIPRFDESNLPFTNRATQKLINKSLIFEDIETKIEGRNVRIKEVQNKRITVEFEEDPIYRVGDSVRIDIPKKIIAVADFEVIRGHDKSISVVSMESLITALVNSGQFDVVERRKLKAVLKELQIGATGLTDSNNAKKIGELLQADLILTGTFANLGSYWNVNLRLVDVRTGIIAVAFEEEALFSDIKPNATRDVSNINEDFEGEGKRGWVIFSGERWGAAHTIKVDRKNGAAGTPSSIKTEFKLKNSPSFTRIVNLRNRDLSLFSGIEFYAKSDIELNTHFSMRDENRDDHNIKDHWFSIFQTGSEWKKVRLDFNELSLSQDFTKNNPGGDGVLNLDLISGFGFGAATDHNPVGTSGTLWIDEVRFY